MLLSEVYFIEYVFLNVSKWCKNRYNFLYSLIEICFSLAYSYL